MANFRPNWSRASDLCSDMEAEAGEFPGFVDAGGRRSKLGEADRSTN